MKGGVKKIFNFIKSKGVSNNFDPNNERNKSSDFKTQQKKNTNFNLLLNTENISSIVLFNLLIYRLGKYLKLCLRKSILIPLNRYLI